MYIWLYICFQDKGKIAHLNLLIFPMYALSQWPSFKSFIYSGSLSKLLCVSMHYVVIKYFTFEQSQISLSSLSGRI